MPPLEYRTPDGLTVRLTYERFVDHILSEHREVSLQDIEEALTHAARICAHKDRTNRRIYEGPTKSRFTYDAFLIVSVQLDSEHTGWVVTAYYETLRYQGAQLWPS